MEWIKQCRDWLGRTERTHQWLAEQYECDRSYVTNVLTGRQPPTAELQILVERLSLGDVRAPVLANPLLARSRSKARRRHDAKT